VIELTRLGVMRTQLLAELHDGRADAAAEVAAVVGEADVFTGQVAGEPAELRVYDDALLVVGASGSERVSFCFVQAVETAGYVVTVRVAGRDALAVSRLGHRTGEFSDVLTGRLTQARGRTAAFLGALLPGLDPMALRQAAGLLRDGVAVPASELNGIHPDLADSLIEVCAVPDRRDAARELAARAEVAIGFRQVASVHKAAVGGASWHDHAVAPRIGSHESPGGSFRPGLAGTMAAGLMAGLGPGGLRGLGGIGGIAAGAFGGFGPGGLGAGGPASGGGQFGFGAGYADYGGYWAYRALGAGMNAGGQRQMTRRPDVSRGRLTPSSEDLAALTVTGDDPTVLAFVLASAGGRVAFEVLNAPEAATLVFQAPGKDGLAMINRALVDSGFAPPPAGGQGLASPARPTLPGGAGGLPSSGNTPDPPALLTDLLVGEVPHDDRWSSQVAALLSG
jgi:hypothetical protein